MIKTIRYTRKKANYKKKFKTKTDRDKNFNLVENDQRLI